MGLIAGLICKFSNSTTYKTSPILRFSQNGGGMQKPGHVAQ
jgi:hypothetical protein